MAEAEPEEEQRETEEETQQEVQPELTDSTQEAEIPEESQEVAEIEAIQEVATQAASQQTVYVIQKGDTLAKICMKYYGNLARMDEICEMNQIVDKDNILYGQKIILP